MSKRSPARPEGKAPVEAENGPPSAREALLAGLECAEATMHANTEPELLEGICAAIVKMGGYRMAWVGYPDPAGGKRIIPTARSGAGQDYVDGAKVTWSADDARGRGPVGTAYRTRKPAICHDTARDPGFAPWREEALRRGYGSAIGLPLLWRDECLGVLAVYSGKTGGFRAEETSFLRKLAADVAHGLTALRARTERERLEGEILQICEREQRRIAQDLHDGLCQQLLGISYLAFSLHRRLAQRKDPDANALQTIAETLRSAAADARALSHCVHPVAATPGALMKALREFAHVTSSMFSIDCQFLCPRPVLPSQDQASNLYRIAQEAAGNAIKHGRASRVTIRLQREPGGGLSLTIRDDGVGIPELPVRGPGMGLQIMRYRAANCGGTLDVRKASPCGTLVVCRLPAKRRGPA